MSFSCFDFDNYKLTQEVPFLAKVGDGKPTSLWDCLGLGLLFIGVLVYITKPSNRINRNCWSSFTKTVKYAVYAVYIIWMVVTLCMFIGSRFSHCDFPTLSLVIVCIDVLLLLIVLYDNVTIGSRPSSLRQSFLSNGLAHSEYTHDSNEEVTKIDVANSFFDDNFLQVARRATQKPLSRKYIKILPRFLFNPANSKHKDCGICLQHFDQEYLVVILPCCNQILHENCIVSWFTNKGFCPLCRINVKDVLKAQKAMNIDVDTDNMVALPRCKE